MTSQSAPVPPYTPTQLQQALDSLYGPNASQETCGHIYGFGTLHHELSTLQRITATSLLDVEAQTTPSMDQLLSEATAFQHQHGTPLSLPRVIRATHPSMCLAAEFKRASPSKGDIGPPNSSAGAQALCYHEAGASVISVLTEPRWFKGSLDDLREARIQTTSASGRPVILRKDFVTSRYQIAEAAAFGADTVLLIVATLPLDRLVELIAFARSLHMEPLVEIHALRELDVAIQAGATVIGVNNRNLHTFHLDLGTTEAIARELTRREILFRHGEDAAAITLCALSGMSSSHDVERYRKVGVGMCLIGESLMKACDPAAAIRGLCLNPKDYQSSFPPSSTTSDGLPAGGGAYTAGTKIIKICGLTRPEDALEACRLGANLLGVIFAEKSKRRVSVEQAKAIVNAVRVFGERSNRVIVEECWSEANGSKTTSSVISTLIAKSKALERATQRPLVVGVFQNQPLEFIREMVELCGFDLVQLHGNEGMEAANSRNFGVPALRVVDIESGGMDSQGNSSDIAFSLVKQITSDPVAILLDTAIKGTKNGGGGTGQTFDWSIAECIQRIGLPVIIAGGLMPNNIRQAITTIGPWGVDVAGGVEADGQPGVKDLEKLEKFLSTARYAAAEGCKGF